MTNKTATFLTATVLDAKTDWLTDRQLLLGVE
jgi:hypothetical protein